MEDVTEGADASERPGHDDSDGTLAEADEALRLLAARDLCPRTGARVAPLAHPAQGGWRV